MDGMVAGLLIMGAMAAVAVSISIISAVVSASTYGKMEENDED